MANTCSSFISLDSFILFPQIFHINFLVNIVVLDMTLQSGILLPGYGKETQQTRLHLCHNREEQNMNLHCHDRLKLYKQ
jgi:hypothetical protein